MSQPDLGEIRMGGFTFAPGGWAFCNGQLLAISQNDALFALIGTTYGGDGVQTFALPNLQGQAPMHWGNGPGGFNTTIGQVQGVDTVTLTAQQIPQHTHNHLPGASKDEQTTHRPDNAYPTVGGYYAANPNSGSPMGASITSSAAGGTQPHDNRQPYLVINFVIALQGIFPSRN
jgi:microcystin-dependent protein